MKNNDFMGNVYKERPSDVFRSVTQAIDEIGFVDLPQHLHIVMDIMSEFSYSDALTCKMHDVAGASVERILSDRELVNDMIPWRFLKDGYLLNMVSQATDIIQDEMKEALGLQGNRFKTAFDIFNEPRDPKTKKILHAQYSSGTYRALEYDSGVITGFCIRDTLRINKTSNGIALRPHHWLSAIFHELVHEAEHQIELVQKYKDRVDMPISDCVSDNDFEISEARHALKIDKAFYAVAYDLYRATPSEKLAVSSQNVFRDKMKQGLMKFVR
jgi:hypothetical protein